MAAAHSNDGHSSFYGPEGYLYMTVFGAQAETYTLSTSDLSVSSQGSGVTGQLRVTVVNNDEDCEAIKTRFDMWQDADDVWSQELFSQGAPDRPTAGRAES